MCSVKKKNYDLCGLTVLVTHVFQKVPSNDLNSLSLCLSLSPPTHPPPNSGCLTLKSVFLSSRIKKKRCFQKKKSWFKAIKEQGRWDWVAKERWSGSAGNYGFRHAVDSKSHINKNWLFFFLQFHRNENQQYAMELFTSLKSRTWKIKQGTELQWICYVWQSLTCNNNY